LNTKYLIRSLERQNEKTDLYLNLLYEQAKTMLEMKHLQRKGITQISLEMNMSKSSVCKYFNQIFLDMINVFGINKLIKLRYFLSEHQWKIFIH
jgi:AraC-like DNA-binding protein